LQVWCSQIGFVSSLYYNIILTDFLFQVSLEAHFNTNKLSGFFSSSCFFEVASLVRISKRYSCKWWWQVWMDYIDFFFSRFLLFLTTYLVPRSTSEIFFKNSCNN
jgi:hypothetical protein